MSNYTYTCRKHGIFTVEKGMKEEALKECPKCGKKVEQVFSASGYIAKCNGFYGKSS